MMNHIRPPLMGAREVVEALGEHTTCPYCGAECTDSARETDIGWVAARFRESAVRYICLGCCEDIYSTCASKEFAVHPYLDLVEQAAQIESLDVKEFRRRCLLDQINAAKLRIDEPKERYAERLSHIEELLAELELAD